VCSCGVMELKYTNCMCEGCEKQIETGSGSGQLESGALLDEGIKEAGGWRLEALVVAPHIYVMVRRLLGALLLLCCAVNSL
jgi:hypothetical protein